MKNFILFLALIMAISAPALAESPATPEKFETPVSARHLGPGIMLYKDTFIYGALEKPFIESNETYIPNTKTWDYVENACGAEYRSTKNSICMTDMMRKNRMSQTDYNNNTR